jgi:predicted  nucleic acid-binding Zn-ribbon protein
MGDDSRADKVKFFLMDLCQIFDGVPGVVYTEVRKASKGRRSTMGVTEKLLNLYRVDQQLQGLKVRLRQAEAYLSTQEATLADLAKQKASLESQIRQLRATIANDENEAAAKEARVAALREKMTQASTSKQHTALLTESSTLKNEKAEIEKRVLEMMGKIEQLQERITQTDAQLAERERVRSVAQGDRDKRSAEISERLSELEAMRAAAAKEVPTSALATYQEAMDRGIDEVMAPVEEADRRNLEYTCGACYTHLPIERVSVLLNRGDLTTCPTCNAILFIDETLRTSISDGGIKKKSTPRKKKAAVPADAGEDD